MNSVSFQRACRGGGHTVTSKERRKLVTQARLFHHGHRRRSSPVSVFREAGGFASDLLLTSFVSWLWSLHDARKIKITSWWAIPVLNLLIGLSAALPFYMYLRYDKAEIAPTLTT